MIFHPAFKKGSDNHNSRVSEQYTSNNVIALVYVEIMGYHGKNKHQK